jgi:hypothetical protein
MARTAGVVAERGYCIVICLLVLGGILGCSPSVTYFVAMDGMFRDEPVTAMMLRSGLL